MTVLSHLLQSIVSFQHDLQTCRLSHVLGIFFVRKLIREKKEKFCSKAKKALIRQAQSDQQSDHAASFFQEFGRQVFLSTKPLPLCLALLSFAWFLIEALSFALLVIEPSSPSNSCQGERCLASYGPNLGAVLQCCTACCHDTNVLFCL